MVIENKKNKIFYKSKKLNFFLIPLIFATTFFLVFVDKIDSIIADKIKSTGNDVLIPISMFVSYPVKTLTNGFNKIYEIKNIYDENLRLKKEIKTLKQWQTLSIRLIDENKAYKKLLNVDDDNLMLQHTVKVLNKSPNLFINSININAGKNKKITKNSTIINERGLIGRIIEVGNYTSKAILINDINSNVPVKVFNKEIYAIITGHSSNKYLKLKFIKENAKLIEGQMLVTSGNAGIYPSNIGVGKIFRIKDDQVYIKPFVNFNKLDFVQIVNKR